MISESPANRPTIAQSTPDTLIRQVAADAINDTWRWLYRAYYLRAIDGDTIEVLIDRGMGDLTLEQIRVAGVNAPEISTGTPGNAATVFTDRWCHHNGVGVDLGGRGTILHAPMLVIETHKDRRSFTRYVGHVYSTIGGAPGSLPSSLADDLVTEGHAVRV